MKWFGGISVTIARDYEGVEADTAEEAEVKVKAMFEDELLDEDRSGDLIHTLLEGAEVDDLFPEVVPMTR